MATCTKSMRKAYAKQLRAKMKAECLGNENLKEILARNSLTIDEILKNDDEIKMLSGSGKDICFYFADKERSSVAKTPEEEAKLDTVAKQVDYYRDTEFAASIEKDEQVKAFYSRIINLLDKYFEAVAESLLVLKYRDDYENFRDKFVAEKKKKANENKPKAAK